MRAPATLLLAALLSGPASATGLLEGRLQTGEANLLLGALDFSAPVSTRILVSVGGTTWSDDRLNASVASLRAGLTYARPWQAFTVRALAVPRVEESQAEGGVFTAVFYEPKDDEDFRLVKTLSAGWIRHGLKVLPPATPTALKRQATLGQGVVEAALRQSYFGDFHLSFNAASFYYDRDLTVFRGATTVLPQTDIASFGTLGALAGPAFPEWTAGLQYARPSGESEDLSVSFGWSRTAFHDRGLWLNSWMVAMRFQFSDSVSADFGWNGVEGRRGGLQEFYGTHVAWYWK